MTGKAHDAAQAERADQREHERSCVALHGSLFVPAEELTMDCTVVDLSAGGAGVRCEEAPPLSTFVILAIDGFGQFEAVTVRFVRGVLGLRFQCSSAKCRRLIERLNLCISQGMTTRGQRREQKGRSKAASLHFIRPNGDEVPCEVLEISGEGISLKANDRPSLNELIQFNGMFGRVVRHHEQGFSVKLIATDNVRAIA